MTPTTAPRSPSDGELLTAAAAGDAKATEALIQRHGALVLAACRRQLAGADAEAAAQAVFLVLWQRADAVAASQAATRATALSLPGWLVVTAHHICARVRRAAARRARAEQVARELAMKVTTVTDNEARSHLDEALAALPEPERDIVIRRHLLGESPDTVAQAVGCAVGTVHSRTSRALDRLREWYVRRGIPCGGVVLLALLAEEAHAAAALPSAAIAACQHPTAAATALAAPSSAVPLVFAGGAVQSALVAGLALTMATLLVPLGIRAVRAQAAEVEPLSVTAPALATDEAAPEFLSDEQAQAAWPRGVDVDLRVYSCQARAVLPLLRDVPPAQWQRRSVDEARSIIAAVETAQVQGAVVMMESMNFEGSLGGRMGTGVLRNLHSGAAQPGTARSEDLAPTRIGHAWTLNPKVTAQGMVITDFQFEAGEIAAQDARTVTVRSRRLVQKYLPELKPGEWLVMRLPPPTRTVVPVASVVGGFLTEGGGRPIPEEAYALLLIGVSDPGAPRQH
jgi:RNA polymerase sigma factor (sigma-70 family)